MYLSKLELFGFKSFATKTKFKFSEGIACVIGPNGSGKSNIVDAIRWVLGEQKVSTLRSDKMESIIFNGTLKRQAQSLAEVSLTVENNKNILDSPFTDVVISRRLYRNGESQYLLNNTPCRLKDILNLFMDTGLNANSYSVIELKMVESIISENPEERRVLFEEAAGVTKYKTRRKSAIRKLTATKSDMSRISDMIAEITRNVNSLSRQVGKARRYLKYQEELKENEINLAKYKYNKFQDDIRPLDLQLKEISAIKEDTSHQITLEEALLEEYKNELIQSEQKLSDINKSIYDYDKTIQGIQEEDAVTRTRIDSLQETKKRNISDIQDYAEKQKSLRLNFQEYSKDIETLKAELNELEEQYTKINNDYESEAKLHSSEKEEIEQLDHKYKTVFEKLTEAKELFQNKSYQLNWDEEQKIVIGHEIEKLKNENKYIFQKIKENTERKEKILDSNKQLENKIYQLKVESENFDNQIETIKNNLQKYNSQAETIKSKITFYNQIITNYEGHAKSTKYLMLNKDKFPGMYGPLSDLVSVEEQYKLAVEIALGNALNYVVVKTTDIAKNIIEICKNNDLGRITLLPLDRLKNISIGSPLKNSPYPVLADLIKCPDEFKKIINILSKDVAFVNTLDEALEASNKYPEVNFVTKGGELVNLNREISGGPVFNKEGSLIGRQKQLDELNSEYKRKQNDIKETETELVELTNNRNKITAELEQLEKEAENNRKQINNYDRELDQFNYSKEKISESINQKDEQITALNNQIEILNSEIKEQTDEITNLKIDLESVENERNIKNSKYEKELQSLNLLDKKVQETKINLVTKQNIYQNRINEISRIEDSVKELDELTNKRNKENTEIVNEIEKLTKENENRNTRKIDIHEHRDQKFEEKENFEITYHELKNKIINLENQIKKYRKQHDSSLERSRQLQLNIQENRMKSETIRERIKEEYNIDIEIGIPYDGLQVETVEQDIESLKYKIKQLGQVNPLAVTEYDKESERLEFYQKQFDDLNKAVESLQETIEKINKTARKQFKETFTQIKNNFETVFKSFFVNGEGTLELEENVDPLEANIEILVRPKGKRLQTLNLLSGGEKTLTAISLLFSIYLVKPSPFCILDEIDAPLDDINITRFTDALKKFAEQTQFIVITHNKRTMEAANTLYGVTMEEEGLSKLVSVKFN